MNESAIRCASAPDGKRPAKGAKSAASALRKYAVPQYVPSMKTANALAGLSPHASTRDALAALVGRKVTV